VKPRLLLALFGLASLMAIACNRTPTPDKSRSEATVQQQIAAVIASAGAGATGPNCLSGGDPTLGIGGAFACTGALAAATFTRAICACGTIQGSNAFITDGFDSSVGGPTGALGGDVAANAGIFWSGSSNIGGTLWTPGNVTSSNPSVVRGNLRLGNTLSGSGLFTVNGNAFTVKTLPGNARVLGTTTKVTSVATPCDCSNKVPVASIVVAHRAPANDNSALNLSPTVLVGNNPAKLDLPCGNYYLSQVNAAQPLTIAVHGHTALYVDGNLQASQTLTFQIDPGATLDTFVSGNFSATQTLNLGSLSRPGSCRLFVAGTSFVASGAVAYGCNVYAPNALITLANNSVVSGSIFGANVQSSGNATVHYDKSILGAGSECCSVAGCDDNNPCTADSCNANGTCAHAALANGTTCTDGNGCTSTDTCQAGTCTGSNPVVCTASDQCHVVGSCNPTTGVCSNPIASNGTTCNDGNGCTQTDKCQAGACTGSNPVACTASDQCHSAGICAPSTGVCSNPAVANGTSCNDSNACTVSDKCQVGVCQPGAPVLIDDINPCTVDSCDPTTGVKHLTVAPGTSCADGNLCNGDETCSEAGTCSMGIPLVIDDGNPCTSDNCNAVTGVSHVPTPIGSSCSDGNVCNGGETCNGSGGCSLGVPPAVNDGNSCTTDSCDPVAGVKHTPLNSGSSCSDGDACNGLELCDASASCSSGSPPVIDDQNPCTSDSCDKTAGVLHVAMPIGSSCSDSNACNGAETCDAAGFCALGVPPPVDDHEPCTADSCDPSTGVHHTPVAGGTSCDDANACNGSESCDGAGQCAANAPPVIDDNNPCTVDSCDPAQGVKHVAVSDGFGCDDANQCNGHEVCHAGACLAGTTPTFDDGNPCTADSCDETTGIVHAALTGQTCDDADVCNGVATCSASGQCVPGDSPILDDGDPCTVDACDPIGGPTHALQLAGTACGVGDVCTGFKACSASGQCLPSQPPTLDDGNPCTVDSCDPTLGVTHHPSAVGSACGGQGNACEGIGECDGAGQCVGGQPAVIDDGNACTVDSCDPQLGPKHDPIEIPSDGDPCTVEACDPVHGLTQALAEPGTSCLESTSACEAAICDVGGACLKKSVPGFDDGDPCTNDVCDPKTFSVTHVPAAAGTACSTSPGLCGSKGVCTDQGDCKEVERGPVIDDGNPCTVDVCDAQSGVVQHTPTPPGGACNDRDVCNGLDACDGAGKCMPIASPTAAIDDGNPCTIDICDPVLGVTHAAGQPGIACGTSLFCDALGKCAPAIPDNCVAYCTQKATVTGNQVTYEHCSRQCAVDVSGPCAPQGTDYLTCAVPNMDASTADPAQCSGEKSLLDTCRSTCQAVFGSPTVTPARRACAIYSCSLETGLHVENRPVGSDCQNPYSCARPGKCDDSGECITPGNFPMWSACAGDPPSSFDYPVYEGPGYCYDQICLGSTPNPCWDHAVGVAYPEGTSCSLGPCSLPGTCDRRGICSAVPLVNGTSCDDGDVCNGVARCGDGNNRWTCKPGTPVAKEDFNVCTDDVCDPVSGTVSHLASVGATCDDGDLCNGTAETCSAAGTCVPGVPGPVVEDGNPCTWDYCDGGIVYHEPWSTTCSDGNVCNGLETCQSGVCTPGTAIVFPNDGNLCTTKSCNPVSGLVITPKPLGTSCSNGNACDGAETCNGASTCVAGPVPAVDDQNVCTKDSCNPTTGVAHAVSWPDDGNPCTTAVACDPLGGSTQAPSSVGTSCSDGNACNGSETCDGQGACVAVNVPSVDDHNPCTVDTCDPVTGASHAFALGGAACDDGNVCNGHELCDGKGACMAGNAPPTDDGQACTVDSCDAVQGVRHLWSGDPSCTVLRPTWTNLASSAPSPRDSASGAFADVTSEFVVVTGDNGGALLADTWLFNTQTGRWRQSNAVGPTARAGAALTYDSARKRILLFGGLNGPGGTAQFLTDVWEYDPVIDVWTPRAPNGIAPAARAYAAVAFDVQRGSALLFGGIGATNFADTWEWSSSGGTWSQLATSVGPAARANASMAYDSSTGHLTLFGGAPYSDSAPGQPFADTWDLDPQSGTWTRSTSVAGPAARTAHGLVFDASLKAFTLFGGTGTTRAALGDSWRYTPADQRWSALGSGPPARAGHVMAYSAAQHSVFMGMGLSYSNSGLFTPQFSDIWQYSSATDAWSNRGPAGAPLRLYPGIVYDGRRRTLVALGSAPGVRRDFVWEYDDQTDRWRQSDANFAEGRIAAPFSAGPTLYDPIRGVDIAVMTVDVPLLAFWNGKPLTTRTFEWNGLNWRSGCAIDGLPQYGSVVFDPVRSKVIKLFGRTVNLAKQTSAYPAAFTEIDPATCEQKAVLTDGSQFWPYGREGAGAAWDSRRDQVLVFGGQLVGDFSTSHLNDTWLLTPSTRAWKRLAVSGASPPPAAGRSLTYDPVRDRFVLLTARDTWELNPTSGQWAQVAVGDGPAIPVPLTHSFDLQSSMTFDAVRSSVVAIDPDSNLWDWVGSGWHKRESVAAPSARSGMAGGWSTADNYAVAFGGLNGNGRRTFLGDTWIWKGGWKLLSSPDGNESPTDFNPDRGYAPSPRTGHALAVGFRTSRGASRGVLFGGETTSGLLADTWIWQGEKMAWRRAATAWTPPARTGHAMAQVPNWGVLLFGGKQADGSLADNVNLRFSFNGDSSGNWDFVQQNDNPSPRWGHAMVTDSLRNKVILFGGKAGTTVLAETWEFDPTAARPWKKRAPLQSPPARFGLQLTFDEARARVVMTGGSGASSDSTFDDTWEWDDAGNTWRVRDPERKLPPRVGHVAFYDGGAHQLTVFGGLQYQAQGTSTFAYGDTVAFLKASSSGDGAAKFPVGAGCFNHGDCASGTCVDGYCCNTACSGQCSACNMPGLEGQCSPALGAPRGGRPACAGAQDDCGQCGGNDLNSCGSANGAACSKDGCFDGQFSTSGVCADGTCSAGAVSCEPYGCSEYGCNNQCDTNRPCYSNKYYCLEGACYHLAFITDLTVSPAAPVFGQDEISIEVQLTTDPQGPGASVKYSYDDGGNTVVVCGSDTSCYWTPPHAGQFQFHVETKSYYSSGAYDDRRDFPVTVGEAQ